MPKPRAIDPPVSLHLHLPESVHARLTLHLFSELEGRVPHGAYQSFIVQRINEFFGSQRLSLTPYGVSGEVFGTPATIEALKEKLNV